MLVVPLFSLFVRKSAPSFAPLLTQYENYWRGLLALSAESNVSPPFFSFILLIPLHTSSERLIHYSTLLCSNIYISPCSSTLFSHQLSSTVATMDYSTPCRFVCECALCVCVIMYARCNLWHSLILHSLMQTGKGINMHVRDWSDDWFKHVQCMRWISNRA